MADDFTLTVSRSDSDIVEARRIRREVFVEEQGIPAHLDPDGRDEKAFHVLCRSGQETVSTGRLVVVDDTNGVLARIAVRASYRGCGLGRRIVQMLESTALEQGLKALSLQPHKHLESFYQSLGYQTTAGTEFVGEHELITMQKAIGTSP